MEHIIIGFTVRCPDVIKGSTSMPLSKYDKYFGGKGGAEKAHTSMEKQYGKDRGEQIFYATKNKRKKQFSHAHRS